MSFNPSKCEVVRVTKRRNPVEATYQIHGHDLTKTKTGKYLGVIISEDLPWKAHVDATTMKANNSLAFLFTVHLAVACDVYDGVFLCCSFSHEVSWMRS